MNKNFKPMLAYSLSELELPDLKYPLICQPKIDGIRCCLLEGKAVSRKLKPIPNNYVRESIEYLGIPYVLVDGELIIEGKSFNEIQSLIMSEHGNPDFTYMIFDRLEQWNEATYINRLKSYFITNPFVKYLTYALVNNLEQLLQYEQYYLKEGHEGIILRGLESKYKFGRSTFREQALMKFKRFTDSEAIILDSFPLEVNNNDPTLDNLGYTEHSSHQAGKVKIDQLGSWVVEDANKDSEFFGVQFNVGTGFTQQQRKEFWKDRNLMRGKIITYKHTPFGAKDKPRAPVWKGFRKD